MVRGGDGGSVVMVGGGGGWWWWVNKGREGERDRKKNEWMDEWVYG